MIQHAIRIAKILFPALLVSLIFIPAAFAQTVTNGDFEAVTIPGFDSSNPADIPGWTHGGSPGDALIWRIGYSDGGGSVTITGDGNTSEEQFVTMGGGAGAIGSADWSTTITGLIAGQSYVLHFMTSTETNYQPQAMTVSFLSGSSTGPQAYTPALSSTNYWNGWTSESETFVATNTSAIVDFSVTNTPQDMGLDAVSVSPAAATTPEPASLLLLGTGLLGLAGVARRKLLR